ncbi:MAG: CvpA family protein [Bacillaceae bacterium]|nr:CvpA family protein [Bacillaceae bacterium]
MNTLDLILLFFLAGSLILGFRRGFVWQVIHLLGFVAAYLIAFFYYRDLVPVVSEWIPFPDFSENVYMSFLDVSSSLETIFYSAISFGLLFFATRLLLNAAGHVFHGVVSLPVLSFFNRWLGAMLSLVEVALVLTLLINIAASLPFTMVQQELAHSRISQYVLEKSPVLTEHLQDLWQIYQEDELQKPSENEANPI